MAELTADGISVRRGGEDVLRGISLDVRQNDFLAIIGPNGCGKSTLALTLARVLKPHSGQVMLNGKSINCYAPKEVARHVALLTQLPEAPGGLTVAELTAFGRYPWRSFLGPATRVDRDAIDDAIAVCGLNDLRDRPLQTLSGGQIRRAWISMVIAQNTSTILLDEPTNFLDIAHQLELLELLRRLNRDHGKSIVVVMHDLALAARYADRVVVLNQGRVVADGAPKKVLTRSVLAETFNVDVSIDYGNRDAPTFTPLNVHRLD